MDARKISIIFAPRNIVDRARQLSERFQNHHKEIVHRKTAVSSHSNMGVGFNGIHRYEVSNLGRVRNAHTGEVLKPIKARWGYRRVKLSYKGFRKDFLIHRLVATAFVPGWRNGLQVNHKNGMKNDNRAENLEWVTASENHRHSSDVLLVDVKPVALFDERGHLQHLYNSSQACKRAMGKCVRKAISRHSRYLGFKPFYISVPMYREIVHLVNVHHYTLQAAFIEASLNLNPPPAPPERSGATKEGSNGSMRQRRGSNGSNVGADSLPSREGAGVGSSNIDSDEKA